VKTLREFAVQNNPTQHFRTKRRNTFSAYDCAGSICELEKTTYQIQLYSDKNTHDKLWHSVLSS